MKIFLSTHGKMASGMKSSLNVLMGEVPCLTTFDAYIDDDSVENQVEKFMKENAGELCVLCSDILGGSVNQVLMRYANEENIVVITGINLALLMSLVIACNGDDPSKEAITDMVNESRTMTQVVTLDFEVKEEEEFF